MTAFVGCHVPCSSLRAIKPSFLREVHVLRPGFRLTLTSLVHSRVEGQVKPTQESELETLAPGRLGHQTGGPTGRGLGRRALLVRKWQPSRLPSHRDLAVCRGLLRSQRIASPRFTALRRWVDAKEQRHALPRPSTWLCRKICIHPGVHCSL